MTTKNALEFKAYYEWLGGQNSSAAPDNLSDDELRRLINFDVRVRGSIKTRVGTSTVAWVATAGLSGVKIDRTAEFATVSGTLVQVVLAGNALYNRASATPILASAGYTMSTTVYNNKMYLMIKGSYYTYDGTTITEITNAQGDSMLSTIKSCKYIEARADRIFCSGNPAAPNTLYYSQVGDPTYFKSGQFMVQAASDDGDCITGLREFNEALLVFKARGVWAWFGYSIATDVRFVKLNVHTGTSAERTIKNVGVMLFYLGEDGVYAMTGTYSGSISTSKVSISVDDKFKKLHKATNAYESTACAVYTDGKYYISYCSETGVVGQDMTINNMVMVCHADVDMKRLPWTEYQGIAFRDTLPSSDGTVYYANATTPVFWKFDDSKYGDMGSNMVFHLSTKAYDLGSPIHNKKIKAGWLTLNQGVVEDTTIDVTVHTDYEDTNIVMEDMSADESLVWDYGEWDVARWDWIDTVTKFFKINRKVVRVSIDIDGETNDTTKNMVFLYGTAFMFKMKKPYKG